MSLEKLAEEYWQYTLETQPILATMLGDRRYDDRVSDDTPAARKARRRRYQDFLSRAEELDEAGLVRDARVTLLELRQTLRDGIEDLDTELDSFNVSHFRGPQTFFFQLPSLQPLRSAEEVSAYVTRIEALAGSLAVEGSHLLRGKTAGRFACEVVLDRTLAQLDALLEQSVEGWTMLTHMAKTPEGVDEARMETERARCRRALEERLVPAFREYRRLLAEKLRPGARDPEHPGLAHVPGGEEIYAGLRRGFLSRDMGVEEIHRIGVEEVARLKGEIGALGEKALGTASFPEIQARLRTDPAMSYETAEQVIEAAQAAIRRAEEAAPAFFGLRPSAPCEVHAIPANEAGAATVGYYRGPSPDGSRAGAYFVNTAFPGAPQRFETEVLAFHEAVPGHHFQISLAQGLDELPAFRRHGGSTAYIEGWALYCEQLADEMGLYSGDLERLGMHFFDIKRACRLVVDTGLHGLGWTRQRAVDFMLESSLMSGDPVQKEVDRYIVMPGQALAYKIGQLEIRRLRTEAEEALGERFRLPDFHDRVLEAGAVSLGVLGSRIRHWIEETSRG